MLREFRVNGADAPAAYMVADVDLKTGMGVQKDYANGKAILPTAATAEGIFLVAKAPIATGIWAGYDMLSDYFEEFNSVTAGDNVVLYSYRDDSTFGTDQYDTENITDSSTFPMYVEVGTDGLWTVASGSSKYLAKDIYDDAGHDLLRVEVLDTAGSN